MNKNLCNVVKHCSNCRHWTETIRPMGETYRMGNCFKNPDIMIVEIGACDEWEHK